MRKLCSLSCNYCSTRHTLPSFLHTAYGFCFWWNTTFSTLGLMSDDDPEHSSTTICQFKATAMVLRCGTHLPCSANACASPRSVCGLDRSIRFELDFTLSAGFGSLLSSRCYLRHSTLWLCPDYLQFALRKTSFKVGLVYAFQSD